MNGNRPVKAATTLSASGCIQVLYQTSFPSRRAPSTSSGFGAKSAWAMASLLGEICRAGFYDGRGRRSKEGNSRGEKASAVKGRTRWEDGLRRHFPFRADLVVAV